MKLKYTELKVALQKKCRSVYLLIGEEPYLMNDAALAIKRSWHQQGECDDKRFHLETVNDFKNLISEASTYSLFAEHVLLDAHFEKKTLDQAVKELLQSYLNNANSRCLIIVRAPLLSYKALPTWMTASDQIAVVTLTPFTPNEFKHWINQQLKSRAIEYEPEVVPLIYRYTQGNLLACAQVIDRLSLVVDDTQRLNVPVVQAQLTDQCEYRLSQLVDACLNGQTSTAIHCFRQLTADRTEINLILWIVSQELRQLLKLRHCLNQSQSMNSACKELNIWATRISLYETALKRLSSEELFLLLQYCQRIDQEIKSSQNKIAYLNLERIILSFSSKTKKIQLVHFNSIL